ncbi:Phosphodiesterase YfcE [compost metagenome]
MRLALISDIHGNLPALQACLEEASRRGCDEVVCLGDVFGYFPDGADCMNRLLASNIVCLMGNHEAMLLGGLPLSDAKDEVYQLQRQREMLSPAQLLELRSWLPYMSRTIDSVRILLVHGSPWQPLTEYIYPDSDLSRLDNLPFDAVFMGHTHRPFVKDRHGSLICNVGSCGLPRDFGESAFAIFDTRTRQIEIVRLEQDLEALRERYPGVHPSVYAVLARDNPSKKSI